MTELTPDDVRPIYNRTMGDGFVSANWEALTVYYKAKLAEYANAILAKYAQPSEREIIERERQAWDIACCYHFVTSTAAAAERDRQYPLPKEEPAPVLTDEEINAAWRDERTLPLSYFDASRKIERAVLTKLAEQKP